MRTHNHAVFEDSGYLVWYNRTRICLHKALTLIKCFHVLYQIGGKAVVSVPILLMWKWKPREIYDSAEGYTAELESWTLNWILPWEVLESYLIEAQFLSLENEGVEWSARQYSSNLNVSRDHAGFLISCTPESGKGSLLCIFNNTVPKQCPTTSQSEAWELSGLAGWRPLGFTGSRGNGRSSALMNCSPETKNLLPEAALFERWS